METVTKKWIECFCFPRTRQALAFWSNHKGQALVEFTLVFLLLLVVAWIPADFGLAFYTGQVAQNAVREGARIAAADPTLASGTNHCGPPLSSCFNFGNIFNETAVRLPSALLGPSTIITVQYPDASSSGCNQMVSVNVTGQYPFFFYKVLKMLGFNINAPQITRTSRMRWEYQAPCT